MFQYHRFISASENKIINILKYSKALFFNVIICNVSVTFYSRAVFELVILIFEY